MSKISKEKRNRVVLVGIGTALLVAGLWMTLQSAQRASLDRNSKQIAEEEQKLASAERLVNSRDQLAQQLVTLQDKLQAVEGGMASGDMYAWVIRTFNTFKTTYRVDIPQFSREVLGEVGIIPKFPYKAAMFNIRGTAYYHDFGRFLADLENTYPFIRVQNLEIEPAFVGGGGGNEKPQDAEKLAFRFEIVALIKNDSL